ncbi:molybdate ABC transporter substrate-binding protein [Shewanella yunxiaonensis]|uniref:Molybdate ABC transporter substrate-binding protein n=1 Tax=Shewanella yunxiaonensis TaxID=2829809 RepID=A0ABX7YTM4_9GAMM|nr:MULTISPECIES: molybdate ABC transporter substrate-binding protein [Shewanella]MDF0534608.1 molybdate ABC transporter substrate-binding protein [Shewanella sp. A32]QUN06014.1 molybdate ABC transporter substrate-binding protein [Shewanella yunxiaonensis]
MIVWICRSVLVLVLAWTSLLQAAEIPNIAAAANIKFAMEQIVKNYQQQTGQQLRVSYGSSGNFVAQIKHGAPFQLFLSADEKYVEALSSSGITADNGVIYAYGRLALVAPNNSPLTLDEKLDGVAKLLHDGQLKRFAIANPEHAPYGERARQLLQQKGLWQAMQSSIVYGENVSQAAQFALSGSTQGGIVALSLAMAPQFRERGRYLALPVEQYTPLTQRMVLLNSAGEVTKDFYHYLQSKPARAVFSSFGFALPEEH